LDKDPANRPATAADLGTRLKDVASVGGAITAIHAPLHRGGDAAAKTRDGYAPGTIEEDAVEPGVEEVAKSRWPLVMAIGALIVVAGLVLWLGTKVRREPLAAPVRVAPVTSSEVVPRAPAPLPTAVQPTEIPVASVPPAGPASRSSGVRPKSARPIAVPQSIASPATAVAPAMEPKHKPSRAAEEGLIQENPF
jgi:hypothetical protein